MSKKFNGNFDTGGITMEDAIAMAEWKVKAKGSKVECPDSAFLLALLDQLEGAAHQFALRIMSVTPNLKKDSFLKLFRKSFPPGSPLAIQDQLRGLKLDQFDSFSLFEMAFRNIVRANPDVFTEAAQIHTLIDCVKGVGTLSKELYSLRQTSIDKAMESLRARVEALVVIEGVQVFKSSAVKQFPSLTELQDTSVSTPVKPLPNPLTPSTPYSTPYNNYNGGSGNQYNNGGNGNNGNIRCYACGSFGHIARFCNSNNMLAISYCESGNVNANVSNTGVASLVGKFLINNQWVRCLVDTGAGKSAISSELAGILKVDIKPSTTSLFSANKTSLKVVGETILEIRLPNHNIVYQKVQVVEDLFCRCIFGIDFMFDNCEHWDIKSGKLGIQGCYIDLTVNGDIYKPMVVVKESNAITAVKSENVEEDYFDFKNLWESYSLCSIMPASLSEATAPITNLVDKYSHIFSDKLVKPGMVETEHQIQLIDENIQITDKPYRVSDSERKFIEQKVLELMFLGVIRKSNSKFSSPVVIAKKDGKLRFCINYKKLNKNTVKTRHPLPNITDIWDSFRDAIIFSKLDLASGYYQIPIAEEDKWKTAFVCHLGLFEFNVMPFGLSNAPGSFQKTMNEVFFGLNFVKVLIDDIAVYSKEGEDHYAQLEIVLQRLEKHRLTANSEKCVFGVPQIVFVGFIVGNNQIKVCENRYIALRAISTPSDSKMLQRLLGLFNYFRRFIKDLASKTKSLYQLTANNVKFVWGKEQQCIVDGLIDDLERSCIVYIPDVTKPFKIETDASDYAIGAVLLQEDNIIGFHSRVLHEHERNYSTSEKECLSVIDALKHWRNYVIDSDIEIITDHQALEILNKPTLMKNQRIIRWQLFMQEFKYTITYRPGRKNYAADALSRPPITNNVNVNSIQVEKATVDVSVEEEDKINYVDLKDIIKFQSEDPELKYIVEYLKNGNLPEDEKLASITAIQSSLYSLDRISEPFEIVGVDIIGPIDVSKNGNKYILVFSDYLTKWVEAFPLPDATAVTVGAIYIREIICRFGAPRKLLSDCGANFLSKVIQAINEVFKVIKVNTTPYHPQTDGLVERFNRTLVQMLKAYVIANAYSWDEYIPMVLFAYRTSVQSSTGFSPYYLTYGREPKIPLDVLLPRICKVDFKVPSDWKESIEKNLRVAFKIARENMKNAQESQAIHYNKKKVNCNYVVDQQVLIRNFMNLSGVNKFNPKWRGPYKIIKNLGNNSYELDLPKEFTNRIVNVQNMKPYYLRVF
eukprot:gene10890-13341_t